MSLPDRTLCWVEGPPWDRYCEPVSDDTTAELAAQLRDALNVVDRLRESIAFLRCCEASGETGADHEAVITAMELADNLLLLRRS